MEGFLLGLSSGAFCIMYCAPLAVPFFLSENAGWGKNTRKVFVYILGRFLGYIVFGAILGSMGAYAVGYLDPVVKRQFSAFGAIAAGAYMLLTGLMYNFPKFEICKLFRKIYKQGSSAFIYGFLTGLSLCPPFFAAAARVFGEGGGAVSGVLYFGSFFLGTAIYHLPLFGIPIFQKKMEMVMMTARSVMILMGGYFFFFLGLLKL